jgi:hypothetical protein
MFTLFVAITVLKYLKAFYTPKDMFYLYPYLRYHTVELHLLFRQHPVARFLKRCHTVEMYVCYTLITLVPY